jgi:tetratricopeptide (TPR) repeat protein
MKSRKLSYLIVAFTVILMGVCIYQPAALGRYDNKKMTVSLNGKSAEAYINESLSQAAKAKSDDHKAFYYEKAAKVYYYNLNDYNNAIKYYKLAVNADKKHGPYEQLIYIYYKTGKASDGKKLYNQCKSMKACGPSGMGHIMLELGKYDDALAFYQQSLNNAKKSGSNLEEDYGNIANVYLSMGNYDKVIATCKQCMTDLKPGANSANEAFCKAPLKELKKRLKKR